MHETKSKYDYPQRRATRIKFYDHSCLFNQSVTESMTELVTRVGGRCVVERYKKESMFALLAGTK